MILQKKKDLVFRWLKIRNDLRVLFGIRSHGSHLSGVSVVAALCFGTITELDWHWHWHFCHPFKVLSLIIKVWDE
jgi:hypothetical protein